MKKKNAIHLLVSPPPHRIYKKPPNSFLTDAQRQRCRIKQSEDFDEEVSDPLFKLEEDSEKEGWAD